MIRIKKYKRVLSTNLLAKKLKEPMPWMIILAEEQQKGYGRKGTGWFSPRGGLYFSIILPKSNIEDLQTLTILAAFIVAKVIKENFDLEPFIKLPNDVWIAGKKIAGVLTENVVGKEVKFSVIGIGLNTNIKKFPQGLEKTATSLKMELGKEVRNEEVLKKILQGLKEQLKIIGE